MPTKNTAIGGQKKNLTTNEQQMLNKPVKEQKEKNTGKKVAIVVASALLAATTLTIPAVIYYTNHQDFQVEIHAVGEDLSSNQTLKLKKGSTIGDIQAPNRDGYYFAGFYADEGLEDLLSLDTKITKGTTVYLKYIIINYVFTNATDFDNIEIQNLSGEKLDTTQPLHHGDKFAVKLTTKTGYDSTFSITGAEFTEEYTEAGLPIYKIVADNKTAEDKDITLHYEEQIQTFIVHFFDFDGVEQTSQSVQYNNSITVENPQKESTVAEQFSFAGWLIVDQDNQQIGEEKQYFDFSTPITANLYVRADFTSSPREYTLTIDAEDQSHVKVELKQGETYTDITAQTEIHYGDELKISYTLSDNADLVTFKINGEDYSETEPSEEINLTVEGNLTIDFEEIIQTNLTFKMNDTNDGYIVTGFKEGMDSTELIIPDTYMGLPVTEIEYNAFSYYEITSLTFGKNCKHTGTFYDLAKINYTGTLKEWCESSIMKDNKVSLEQSFGPHGVDLYINGQQVKGDLVIPDDVTKINDYAFYYNNDITSVKIGKNVESIGHFSFYDCYNLTSIYVEDDCNLQSIGNMAFRFAGFIKVTIPKNVKKIVSDAFDNCGRLIEVVNKSELQLTPGNNDNGSVAKYAKQVISDETQSKLTIEDGIYYYDDGDNYIAAGLADPQKTEIVLSDKTTEINQDAFEHSSITSVTLNQNLKSIGSNAFADCNELIEVINKSQIDLKQDTNNGLYGYAAVVLSDENDKGQIETIDGVIYYRYNDELIACGLESYKSTITLQDGTTRIKGGAFVIERQERVDMLTIPASVKSLGSKVFNFKGNITILGNEVFRAIAIDNYELVIGNKIYVKKSAGSRNINKFLYREDENEPFACSSNDEYYIYTCTGD